MKTFKSFYLTELFNTNVPVKVDGTWPTRSSYLTSFYVNDMKFVWSAKPSEGVIEISFVRIPGGYYALNDLDLKDTLAVFSGVKKSFELWHKWYEKEIGPIDIFKFAANENESSRVKIYQKFAKQVAKKMKMTAKGETIRGKEYYVFRK
jgi:hypothetical protein